MRLLALGAATAIASVVSFGLSAADFAYPPRVSGAPYYGLTPGPHVAPPTVTVVPAPDNDAPIPPAAIGPPRSGGSPSAPLGVRPGIPLPQPVCGPAWRCGDHGCNWQSSCAPHPEAYPDRNVSQRPGVAGSREFLVVQQPPVSIEPGGEIERGQGSPLILLGQRLFHDRRLSRTGKTAC